MKMKYMIAALAMACVGTGCDDKLETFEVQGYTGVPAAIEASNITSTALEGKIQLNWTVPEGAEFSYLKIWYNDPLLKTDVYKVASIGTTEMLIEDTRARFGEYEFFFQTFNANNEGSEVTSFKAVSGKAPAVANEVSRTEVKLDVSQLSSDAPDETEGVFANLLDGKFDNLFHIDWHNPTPLPHYIQIDFKEEHQVFAMEWWDRASGGSGEGFPTSVQFQVSSDGNDWETVAVLSGFAAGYGAHVSTEYVDAGKPFTYFRYNVTTALNAPNYFHLAELKFYDVELEVYDPETVELD